MGLLALRRVGNEPSLQLRNFAHFCANNLVAIKCLIIVNRFLGYLMAFTKLLKCLVGTFVTALVIFTELYKNKYNRILQ